MHFILLCISIKYLLVFVEAEPSESDMELRTIVGNSFYENINNALAKGVMRADHVKQLLDKSGIEMDPSFHEELKNILHLYLQFYFINDMPSIIPYVNEFLELEMKKPQSVIQCNLLTDFKTFLATKQATVEEKYISVQEQFQSALQARLDSLKLIENKAANEKSFYKDLFYEFDKNEKWIEEVGAKIEHHFTCIENIIDRLNIAIDDFYEGLELKTLQ